MKALSIRQPWAWLILHGGKDIENRSWNTNFRGRFLIHAAAGMTITLSSIRGQLGWFDIPRDVLDTIYPRSTDA